MNTPRPPEHEFDPEIAARYRTASEHADEVPGPEVRHAVLAAAARNIAARPRAVDSSLAPPSAPSAGPFASRKRWPLAAAAAVVLSSIAILLATRVERGTTEAPTAPRSEAQIANDQAAATAAAPPAAAAPAAKPAGSVQAEQPRQTSEKKNRPAADALTAPDRALESRVASPPAAEPESGASKIEAPAPTPELPAAPAPPAGLLRSNAGSGAKSAAPAAAMRERASPNGGGTADTLDEDDPQRWIERIVKLRAAGDDGRADAEVRRFRTRYPTIALPPAALARTGTR